MTPFAENEVVYSDTQKNVETPPDTLFLNGFMPKTRSGRGQPLVANWLNWLFRELFRGINRDRISDGNGIGTILVSESDCFIQVFALQKSDTTKFISAIGYKPVGGIPSFNVQSNANLAFGTVTATDTPITGAPADDIIQYIHVQKA